MAKKKRQSTEDAGPTVGDFEDAAEGLLQRVIAKVKGDLPEEAGSAAEPVPERSPGENEAASVAQQQQLSCPVCGTAVRRGEACKVDGHRVELGP